MSAAHSCGSVEIIKYMITMFRDSYVYLAEAIKNDQINVVRYIINNTTFKHLCKMTDIKSLHMGKILFKSRFMPSYYDDFIYMLVSGKRYSEFLWYLNNGLDAHAINGNCLHFLLNSLSDKTSFDIYISIIKKFPSKSVTSSSQQFLIVVKNNLLQMMPDEFGKSLPTTFLRKDLLEHCSNTNDKVSLRLLIINKVLSYQDCLIECLTISNKSSSFVDVQNVKISNELLVYLEKIKDEIENVTLNNNVYDYVNNIDQALFVIKLGSPFDLTIVNKYPTLLNMFG
jgi:hypothetical protein